MKTFSIAETRHNLSQVLAFVESGHPVGIRRRNRIVARIVPAEERAILPDFVARATKIWEGKWKGASSDDLLEETRGHQ